MPIRALDDEFRQQRVVTGRYLDAGFNPGIAARRVWKYDFGEQAGLRLELTGRVFGIQSRLNGMAARRDRQGIQWRQFIRRQPQHPFHQINAGDLLGDAVLDLQAGVHFQEVEGIAGGIDDEFHRACRAVVNRLHQANRSLVQGLPHGIGQMWRRGFLDHLLVAALQRTVAFAESQHAAAPIAEYLHFNMPGLFDELFQKYSGVAEVAAPEALHRGKGCLQVGAVAAQAHADTATAGSAFQHHRITDVRRRRLGLGNAVQQFAARQQRCRVALCQLTGGVFEAKAFHLRWRGADEGDAGLFAGQGKGSVFTEKAVAGMNGLGAAAACRVENALDVQIGFSGEAFADPDGYIGVQYMAGPVVGAGVHRDRTDAHALQGADDPAGDGAAIGN